MKILKGLFMILITVSLFFVMITGTLNLLLSSTVLSNQYIEQKYEEYKFASRLSEVFYDKIDNFAIEPEKNEEPNGEEPSAKEPNNEEPSDEAIAGQEILDGYKETLKEAMKPEWFETQTKLFVIKTHGYITGSGDKLPTINIEPIKKVLPEMLISGVISQQNQNNDLTRIDHMLTIIRSKLKNESLLGVARNQTIAQLLEESNIKELKLSEEVVYAMVKKVDVMDEQQLTNEDFYNYMVELVITDQMKLDQMKDEVDLNSLVSHLFEGQNNPLAEIRSMVYSIKVILIAVHLVVICCLLTMVFLIKMSLYKTLRFFGILCLPIGGFEFLLGRLLRQGIENVNTQNAFAANVGKGMGEDLILRYILFGGGTLVLGVLLIAFSIVLIKMKKTNAEKAIIENTYNEADVDTGLSEHQRGLRIIGMLMLIAVLCFTILRFEQSFEQKTDNFSRNMKYFSEEMKQKDLSQIILNEMGIEYAEDTKESN